MDLVTFKDWVTVVLSVLALSVSLFNLWWGNFRKRVALYYLQMGPSSYVLVNGGKTDVLITHVGQHFQGIEASARAELGDTGISDGDPVLIKAGQAVQQKITGEQAFPVEALFKSSKKLESGLHVLDVVITVAWVDVDGHRHYAEFKTGIYSVTPTELGAWWLIDDQIDLTDRSFSVTRLEPRANRKPFWKRRYRDLRFPAPDEL